MTLGELLNKVGFQVDQQSVQEVNNAFNSIKSTATKLLGAIGIGFSVKSLVSISEEFNQINDRINAIVDAEHDAKEVQQDILAAANASKTSYSQMASTVESLYNMNSELFPLEDATKFAEYVQKIGLTAGYTDGEISSMQSSLQRIFASGTASGSDITRMLRSTPALAKQLADALGVGTDQLSAMAEAGQLTGQTIKDAILGAADEIDASFSNLNYSISDATLHIRNSFGYFVDDLNSSLLITQTLAKMMTEAFDKVYGGLQKAKDGIMWLADKLGGTQTLLELFAVAAGAIFVAFNFDKITKGLSSVGGLLKALRPGTLLLVAGIALLALAIQDVVSFMQGKDSMLGRYLEQSGVDVDEFRENIVQKFEEIKEAIGNIFEQIGKAGSDAIEALVKFWDEHGGTLEEIITRVMEAFANMDVGGLEGGFSTFAGVLEKVAQAFLDLLGAGLDFLQFLLDNPTAMTLFTTALGTAAAMMGVFKASQSDTGKGLQTLFGLLKSGTGPIEAITTAFEGAKNVGGLLSKAISGAGAAFSFITSPIGIAIMVIGALIAVGVLLYQNWDKIKEVATNVWEGIKGAWSAAGEWFNSNVVQPIVEFITSLKESISSKVEEISTAIQDGLQTAIDWITSLPEQAVQWGADIINGIKEGISGAIDGVAEAAKGVAGKISSFLHFSKPDEGPLADFDTYMPDMIDLMASGIESGRDQIQEAMSGLTGDISATAQVDANTPDIGTQLLESVQAAVPKIQATLNKLMASMSVMANANIVLPSTRAAATGSNNVSKSVNQNIEINNKFEGDRAGQEKSATAMNKAAKDSTAELARGLAYAR